jgi:transketolase
MPDVKKIATRVSYGNALAELGKEHEDIVVLDADLSGSTKSATFGKYFPERFINTGIQECNMIGMAAGLATTGMVPFVSSFAMFATGRTYEIIRNSVGYPCLNVKVCASHAGISVGADGASHQCIEDIGLMRLIPNMTVMQPCDDVEARAMVKAAYEHKGPAYIRFSRLATPVYNDENYKFEWGKGVTMREGSDVTIISSGMVAIYSYEAAKLLEKEGISVRVINIHTIKPIDEDIVIKAAKETKMLFTAEEHSVIGGLGSAVSDVLIEKYPVKVRKIGIYDRFGESGSAEELLHLFGLDSDGIYKRVKEEYTAEFR